LLVSFDQDSLQFDSGLGCFEANAESLGTNQRKGIGCSGFVSDPFSLESIDPRFWGIEDESTGLVG
jgi:hypothetical protein